MTPAQSSAVEELDRRIRSCRTSGMGATWMIELGVEDARGIRQLIDDQQSELEELRASKLSPATP